jgi:Domain of unknown function (DUF4124)
MRIPARSFLVAILGLWLVDASATTLYKLVDPNGHVTFTDVRPSDVGGNVIRLEIDSSANAVAPVKPPEESQAEIANERIILQRPDTSIEDRIQAARARIEAASGALDAALDVPGAATDNSDTLTDDSDTLADDSDTLTDDSDSPADAPGKLDYYFVQVRGGHGNHGVRLMFSAQYASRLAQLTQDLESAKRELAALESRETIP